MAVVARLGHSWRQVARARSRPLFVAVVGRAKPLMVAVNARARARAYLVTVDATTRPFLVAAVTRAFLGLGQRLLEHFWG